MRLYCNETMVLAIHDDDQNIEPSVYGAGVVIIAAEAPPPDENGVIARPEVTPEILAATKMLARARVCRFADRATVAITGHLPVDEKISWSEKKAEALAYQADSQAPTPILAAEVAITGETVADLAAEVMANALARCTTFGQVGGLRRTACAAIEAADSPEAIEAALTAAQTQAEAMLAAALGA